MGYARPGLPEFQFRKIWPFLKWAGHEKTHLAFILNLAIFGHFSVCHCKTKFSLKISGFVYFLDGLHVIVTVTRCNYQLALF